MYVRLTYIQNLLPAKQLFQVMHDITSALGCPWTRQTMSKWICIFLISWELLVFALGSWKYWSCFNCTQKSRGVMSSMESVPRVKWVLSVLELCSPRFSCLQWEIVVYSCPRWKQVSSADLMCWKGLLHPRKVHSSWKICLNYSPDEGASCRCLHTSFINSARFSVFCWVGVNHFIIRKSLVRLLPSQVILFAGTAYIIIREACHTKWRGSECTSTMPEEEFRISAGVPASPIAEFLLQVFGRRRATNGDENDLFRMHLSFLCCFLEVSGVAKAT